MVDRALSDINFLRRVQQKFDPQDMTQDNLEQMLYHGESGKHKIKWGLDDKGKQRYREVEGASISSGTIDLATVLSETSKVYKKIEKEDSVIKLKRLKKEAVSVHVHSDTLIGTIDEKIKEREVEELKEKGKVATIFRNELKRATSISEIDSILSRAKSELGEGKNYDSLVEAG